LGLLTLIELALLRLKMRQFRREECGLVIPNKRRATTSGAFSGATRRAGSVFSPAAFSFAHTDIQYIAHSDLLYEKIVPAESIQLVLTGPNKEIFTSGKWIQ
jgi:hypothetical protein